MTRGNLTFTEHALERLQEYGFTVDEAYRVYLHPLAVWPQENGRWVFQGESFRLVREAGEAVIVTVLPGKGRRP